jgi:uncharacterized membrane protein
MSQTATRPIDKLSLPLTILLATAWLDEPFSWRLTPGVVLVPAETA